MNFGAKLRAMRVMRGMTQAELSAGSGVSQQLISILEKDRALPMEEEEQQLRDSLEWSGVIDVAFRLMDADLPRELSARVLAIGEELDVETW